VVRSERVLNTTLWAAKAAGRVTPQVQAAFGSILQPAILMLLVERVSVLVR
jgi:hypothetical protein